jgi:MarR family transcriptional regulator, organic hydroperoxide resistance regulator
MTPQSPKRDVAADVWRLMLEAAMSQFAGSSTILQQSGLTPGHAKLLMHLDLDEAKPMGALAQSFQCDASTMTWLVDRLEERGIVERRSLPSDRRVKAVGLTPFGVETKERLLEQLYEPPAELVALDRESLETLRVALKKIRGSAATGPPIVAPATA